MLIVCVAEIFSRSLNSAMSFQCSQFPFQSLNQRVMSICQSGKAFEQRYGLACSFFFSTRTNVIAFEGCISHYR